MCSTCNYNNFEKVLINDKPYLERQLGYGNLRLRCDTLGHNWKLDIKDQEKSEFTIYRCPTCGKMLI